MADKIDAKYLEGLTFADTEVRKVKQEDGRTKDRHFPTTRPLTEDDVMAWREEGGVIVICTKDGQKYRVPKKAAKKEK